MDALNILMDAFGRIRVGLERSLAGVSTETLKQIPGSDANSMAWLAWHLTRVQDHHMSDLAGVEQVWIRDSWYEHFAMDSDKLDIGFGHTPEQVAAVSPVSGDLLRDYHIAVYTRSERYIGNMDPNRLDQEIDEPQWDPRPTVGVRLVSVINDNTQHVGQMAYIRGLIEGRGWMSY
jgi:uncharacterized damage-inducible protein DinB